MNTVTSDHRWDNPKVENVTVQLRKVWIPWTIAWIPCMIQGNGKRVLLVLEFTFLATLSHVLPTPQDSVFEWQNIVLEFIFLATWLHVLPDACSNGKSLFPSFYFSLRGLTSFRLRVRMANPCSRVEFFRHVVSRPFRLNLSNDKSLFSSLYFSPRGLASFRLCVWMENPGRNVKNMLCSATKKECEKFAMFSDQEARLGTIC